MIIYALENLPCCTATVALLFFLRQSSLFENIASSYTHFTSVTENFTNIFSIFAASCSNSSTVIVYVIHFVLSLMCPHVRYQMVLNRIPLDWAWAIVLDFCSTWTLLNSTFGLGSCYKIISNKSYKCIVMLFCVLLSRFDGHLVSDCDMTIWRIPQRFIWTHCKKIAM